MKPNERLKSIMKSSGITQEQLSEESGVSQPTINRMVKGSQNLNWHVLKALRTTYKVDINKFFDK